MISKENNLRKSVLKHSKYPVSFHTRTSLSLLIILIFVSVFSFFAYRYGEKVSNERRQMYMFSVAKTSKQQIQNWFESIMSKCELIKLNNSNESRIYSEFLKKYPLSTELQGNQHPGFNKSLEDIRKTLTCTSIVVSSKDGKIQSSVNSNIYALDDDIKRIILESLDKNEVRVSSVNFDVQNSKAYLSFIVPFITYNNPYKKGEFSPEHALVITYDLESELSTIADLSSMVKSKTFEELIVFKKGESLVLLNKLGEDGKKWKPLLIPMTSEKSPSYYVLEGNEGAFLGVDYRGEHVISTAAYIPELNWGVIQKIDSAEAFNILRTTLIFVVGSCLLIILLFGWFILNYAKKQGESAVRKIEKLEQYRAALLSVYPDLIVNMDMKRNIIWLNDAGIEFFGEDAIGRNITSFMTAITRDVVKDNYYDFLFSGKKTNVTSVQWFRNNDGEEKILSWTSCILVDNEGNQSGVFATARGVTEQKSPEKWIEDSSEQYLRTIVSSLIDGLVVIDREMKITDVNEYICTLLGYERDELIGDKLIKIYPDTGYDLLRKSIGRHFQEEVSINGLEIDLLTKSGEIIPTSIKAVLLKDYEGKVFGSLGLIRDMREIKVLQENLVQAEKLSSVGEMAAGVAHELNNPLTAIIGYSDLLMEKKVSDEVEKQIRKINQQSQRCKDIVSNLLMFSRKYEAKKEKIDLNELVKVARALTAYDMESSGINVEEDYSDAMPPAYIEGNKIQQVIVNLLQNAKHAVENCKNEGKRIIVKTKCDDKFFSIEVSDNGIGIDPENIKRIFDPFFTTKEVGKGTGLGLSISYGIIKEHGGDIYTRSKQGEGAHFIIKLPVEIREDNNTAEIGSSDEGKEVEFGKKTVLIVDDEEVIRDILNLYLSDEGHEVEMVESAVKALEMLKRKKYDIIFSDIKMPDLDGFRFLENLKKNNKLLAERVIFITGDSTSFDSHGNGNGMKNLILTKPFTIHEVKKILQEFDTSSQ